MSRKLSRILGIILGLCLPNPLAAQTTVDLSSIYIKFGSSLLVVDPISLQSSATLVLPEGTSEIHPGIWNENPNDPRIVTTHISGGALIASLLNPTGTTQSELNLGLLPSKGLTVAFVDYNKDGIKDIAVVDHSSGNLTVHVNPFAVNASLKSTQNRTLPIGISYALADKDNILVVTKKDVVTRRGRKKIKSTKYFANFVNSLSVTSVRSISGATSNPLVLSSGASQVLVFAKRNRDKISVKSTSPSGEVLNQKYEANSFAVLNINGSQVLLLGKSDGSFYLLDPFSGTLSAIFQLNLAALTGATIPVGPLAGLPQEIIDTANAIIVVSNQTNVSYVTIINLYTALEQLFAQYGIQSEDQYRVYDYIGSNGSSASNNAFDTTFIDPAVQLVTSLQSINCDRMINHSDGYRRGFVWKASDSRRNQTALITNSLPYEFYAMNITGGFLDPNTFKLKVKGDFTGFYPEAGRGALFRFKKTLAQMGSIFRSTGKKAIFRLVGKNPITGEVSKLCWTTQRVDRRVDD